MVKTKTTGPKGAAAAAARKSTGGKVVRKQTNGKLPAPPSAKAGGGEKKKRKRTTEGHEYALYIHKVMRTLDPGMKITAQGMVVMNQLIMKVLDDLSLSCIDLARGRRTGMTLTSLNIQSAIRLRFGTEMAKHAIAQSSMAIHRLAELNREKTKAAPEASQV